MQRGVFNTVGTDPSNGPSRGVVRAVWSSGFITGLAVSALERSSSGVLRKSLGWSMLALAMFGVVLMPASGFWLAFPPAIAVLV